MTLLHVTHLNNGTCFLKALEDKRLINEPQLIIVITVIIGTLALWECLVVVKDKQTFVFVVLLSPICDDESAE